MEFKVLISTFLGASFAFLFGMFASYLKNRNRLKFNISKTSYLLTAYENYIKQDMIVIEKYLKDIAKDQFDYSKIFQSNDNGELINLREKIFDS